MADAGLLAAQADLRRFHEDLMKGFGSLDLAREEIAHEPNSSRKDFALQGLDKAIAACTSLRMAIGPALRLVDQYVENN